jgi:hypothetical protein
MFTNDRNQMRKVFFDSWKAHRENAPMDAMQKIIANIIELHPEYHTLLEKEDNLDKDYLPDHGETNPFLHMSMHIALHEQISTNRPAGIADTYQQLIKTHNSAHDAEHAMMECLGESLWRAQRDQRMPDEDTYMKCLAMLCHK